MPILPKFNSGIFLLMDTLWHVRRAGRSAIPSTILSATRSSRAISKCLTGLWKWKWTGRPQWAVFLARNQGERFSHLLVRHAALIPFGPGTGRQDVGLCI
jgi:hypothetical protein